MLTGKSKLEFKKNKKLKYETLFLTPYDDIKRAELYEKIDARVQSMFHDGLVNEVQELVQKYGKNAP
jgi:tRNA A37 N6-isopentenylltransferase MiaA